ncbi:hypothetical protein [Pseudomonas poae]|uniref:Uncharacterized protein n=1 Tax=Pseudomonas poae TaxID=200451 RepID=A0A2S9EJA3_9PSED|nr:hypothetical protein [Pseudomonas poae]PRA26219.1 hypothetical protein CQZ97_21335 [Pseudomonas poae]PRC15384.1 hypothetical protein CQZ99_17900 [Pseudomonas poae]
MQQLDFVVPYEDRCVLTPSGSAVVWPFMNASKGYGPYEFFLDANALTKTQWAVELPRDVVERSILNPWPAMQEQWLSNPEFRADPVNRINAMIKPLVDQGFAFRENFARDQVALLCKNEAALKTQFSLIFPYVVIMKALLSKKMPLDEALRQLDRIGQADIPRFTANLMLSALGVVLKSKQALKLTGDSKTAFSYLDSFLAFQSGQKGETDHITLPYLRNRAGDLNLWLLLPTLRQKGYKFVGTPAVVTGDKVLHRLIMRVLPPLLHGSQQACFSILPEGMEDMQWQKILQVVESVQIRANLTATQRSQRMKALFELAKEFCADDAERAELDEGWTQWCLPGLARDIRM